MPLPPKKKKADLAILIDGPEKPAPGDEMEPDGDEMPEEDEGDFADLEEEDPLAAEGEEPFAEEAAAEIDPEYAPLLETLGFTDPEQQQAFLDLIELVNSKKNSSMMGSEDSGALPPLPESTY